MSPFAAELIGTMILVTLGDGVVANVKLAKTGGHAGGWLLIATGWGLAVAFGAYLSMAVSGAHLNPAVTIGLAVIGDFPLADVPIYLAAQMIGAFLGAVIVWLAYLPHWEATDDPAGKLGVFCTAPGIRDLTANVITEIIGTFVLVLGALAVLRPENMVPNSGFKEGFAPILVGLIVWAIGISLGGPTGYAINPARDLGPRIAHALLPIPGKGPSDWGYAAVPIIGPIIGGIFGAAFYQFFFS